MAQLDDPELAAQLRQVFDLCDDTNCGYITVDKMCKLGQQHFGGSSEHMQQLISYIDPNSRGIITFPDFCRGVALLLQDTSSAATVAPPDSECRQLDDGIDCSSNRPLSPCFTARTANDSPTCDDVDSTVENRVRVDSPTDSGLGGGSHGSPMLPHNNSKQRISPSFCSDSEERFECDGEETTECQNDLLKGPLSSDSFRSNSSTGSGGSGGKQRSFAPRNTWLRTSLRRSSGSSKRISSNALARELFSSPSLLSSSNQSPVHGSTSLTNHGSRRSSLSGDEDILLTEQQEVVDDLSDKVHMLQMQVSALSDDLNSNGDLYRRVKQENGHLTERIHTLEEQLHDLEAKAEERSRHDEVRFRDAFQRQDREKSSHMDQYATKLFELQQQNLAAKEEAMMLRNTINQLKHEKQMLEQKLEDATSEVEVLKDDVRSLQELSRKEHEEYLQERTVNARLLQDLTHELEEARRLKRLSMDNASISDMPPTTQAKLEADLERVCEENRTLREHNELLQAQLLSSRLEQGRSLVEEGSLASEIEELNTYSKEQLITTVKSVKEDNQRIRDYVDNILMCILENNPEILEVKCLDK